MLTDFLALWTHRLIDLLSTRPIRSRCLLLLKCFSKRDVRDAVIIVAERDPLELDLEVPCQRFEACGTFGLAREDFGVKRVYHLTSARKNTIIAAKSSSIFNPTNNPMSHKAV